MSNSGDKRWEEKDDGISTLLREQNEELIKKCNEYKSLYQKQLK